MTLYHSKNRENSCTCFSIAGVLFFGKIIFVKRKINQPNRLKGAFFNLMGAFFDRHGEVY